MPTKRLTLATPLSDGTNDFPFVDVRLWALSDLVNPAALLAALDPTSPVLDSNGFFDFAVNLTLALSFYRLVSGRRILLADDSYTPQVRLFTISRKLKVNTGIILDAFNFYYCVYSAAGSLNSLSPNAIRYSFESENSLEAIPRTSELDAIDFLPSILIQECGSDFAGLTVVEAEE